MRPTPPVAVDPRLPYLALLFVIGAWGAGPVVTKLITAPPVVGALIRFGISIPVLFAIVVLRGRRVERRTMLTAAPPGLAFGVNLIFVFETVQEATVAVLAVAVALQPTVILVIAGPLFGERPRATQVWWTLVGVAGAAGVVVGAGAELRASALGVIFALTAMATFTVYFVLTRLVRSRTDVDPIDWMAAINVWAFLAIVPVAALTADRADFAMVGGRDWLWLAVLAYGTGVFGHVLMSWVHGYLEASRSSLSILVMNVVAVALAWPVHDEAVTWIQALAGVVVFGAVAAVLRTPAPTRRRIVGVEVPRDDRT